MKTIRLLFVALFASTAAFGQSTDIKQNAAGTVYGRTGSKLSFFGAAPHALPANTRTARQAMQDLGLLATGGAQDSDVFSLTADNTLGDGVDLALGTSTGTRFGTGVTQKLAFYNGAPIVQRAGTSGSQTALTDSTTGTAATTLAAGTAISTVSIPIQLAAMTTAAADLVTNYVPGYKFKVLSAEYVTTTIGAGAGASQVLNLEIGTTNVTGGVITLTEAATDTLGEKTAGTSITAANTGTASDTLSVEVATGGTVFTAGAGIVLVKLQNMDTADAIASLARLENELRASLAPTTGVALIKGAD